MPWRWLGGNQWLAFGRPSSSHAKQHSSDAWQSFIAWSLLPHFQHAPVLSGPVQPLELCPNLWQRKHLSGGSVLERIRHIVHPTATLVMSEAACLDIFAVAIC